MPYAVTEGLYSRRCDIRNTHELLSKFLSITANISSSEGAVASVAVMGATSVFCFYSERPFGEEISMEALHLNYVLEEMGLINPSRIFLLSTVEYRVFSGALEHFL